MKVVRTQTVEVEILDLNPFVAPDPEIDISASLSTSLEAPILQIMLTGPKNKLLAWLHSMEEVMLSGKQEIIAAQMFERATIELQDAINVELNRDSIERDFQKVDELYKLVFGIADDVRNESMMGMTKQLNRVIKDLKASVT